MTKYTIQERFFIFLGLVCLGMMFTNHYYLNKYDKDIHESLNKNYDISKTHIANSINKSLAIEHWKSMYLGQKGYGEMLEKQIDVINNYWSKENLKLKDELFDLKHSTTNNSTTPNT